ncbi:MAG: FAD-linked oxidase C-terminal domain-containing protein, partial [Thermodesulfobacteriota bacterium]
GSLASLTALEVAFSECVELVVRQLGLPPPFPSCPPAVVLVECAAGTSPLDELVAAMAQCQDLVRDGAVADDEAAVRRLWRYREAVSEAINAAGVPHKLDVAVPLARIPGFVTAVRTRVAALAPAAQVAIFGHLGDGNLHVNVLGLDPDDETVDREILRLAADAGGTIAAEHGVGVAKVSALELVRGPGDLAAMRATKRALDPRGILNPGVLLPEERQARRS